MRCATVLSALGHCALVWTALGDKFNWRTTAVQLRKYSVLEERLAWAIDGNYASEKLTPLVMQKLYPRQVDDGWTPAILEQQSTLTFVQIWNAWQRAAAAALGDFVKGTNEYNAQEQREREREEGLEEGTLVVPVHELKISPHLDPDWLITQKVARAIIEDEEKAAFFWEKAKAKQAPLFKKAGEDFWSGLS